MSSLSQIIIFLVLGLIGMWFGWTLAMRKRMRGQKKSSGLEAADKARREKKEKAKEKVLEFLRANKRVTNNDIEKLLGVSDATATRYLEALEAEGKIEQQGKTGQSVYYTLK